MTGAHRTADAHQAEVGDALAAGRQRARAVTARPVVGPRAVLALQRQAGNSAVGALMAARARSPGERAVADIDAALVETRRDRPAIDTVERGLRAAQAAGIPVELEGPKPPASALAVTRTGFGPEAVAPRKPVPPAKPVPAVSPLGKAAAKGGPPGKGGGKPAPRTGPKAPAPAAGAGPAPAAGPAPLPADKLLQPPVSPTPVRPEEDPAFAKVVGSVKNVAAIKKAHPPAATKAKEAQGAAVAPADDLGAQAKAAKVDAMDAQPPGSFDKKAFIAAVKTAIEAKSPKTLEEADEYKKSGKAGEVKGDVKGLVGQGKEGQAKDIEAATEAPPDPSKAVAKPVTPMAPETPGTAPRVPAAGAVPKPAPPEQTNLAAGQHQADQEMADAGVTEGQLAQSNEPEFQQALVDKKAAAEHAGTAPAEYRAQEQQTLAQDRAEAAAVTTAGVTGMQGAKGAAMAQLVAAKGKTKSKDEVRRAEVTAKVQSIFAATEADVKKILDGIDPKVDAAFEQGEFVARTVFENYVAAKMSAYKKDRYSGWLGGYRWVRDKIRGMPAKVNEFYAAGRELYLQRMDGVISKVATIVGDDLTRAKQRIAKGKTEIADYVGSLPANLKKVGAEASAEIGDRFDQLEADVNAKQESVVDTLATKYVESRQALDSRIEELQAANKGLVDKAIGAIKAIVNTIRELAAMLRNVLSRVAGVVGDIIKNPIGFLGHLIAGVKGGILRFKDNILAHLRKGLMGWLFGALAEGGVELPDTFDLKGVVKLLASLFGLTWARIRARIAKQIGEPAMTAVEKGVEIFQLIATQGVAGLWQLLVEKIGNIKDMILEKVQDFVVTKVITAGITWLISLLNPAAAFIKACKLIYDVVMFFVNNAARIAKFVDTIIDSVADIVRGNVGGVVAKIENVLGQMVPILIGFLASVLGLGGIGQKIREIVTSLQKPVKRAVDAVIKTGLKLAGPIIRGLKKVGGKVKAGVAAGKAWVKGKAEAGARSLKAKLSGERRPMTPEEDVRDRWSKGMRAIKAVSGRSRGGGVKTEELHQALTTIKTTYKFQEIRATRQGKNWGVYAKLNPDNADRLVPISGKTLLVGEGNLTFTEANIIVGRALPGDITATVYEKKEKKSASTRARAEKLEAQGVTVEFGVDATKLHEGAEEKPKFDTIVWMFPHPGGERAQAAAAGKALLAAFFASAATRLHPGGKITVTLRKAKRDWYISRWDPVGAAASAGLRLERRLDFEQRDYEGYTHETTEKGARTANVTTGYTFVFTR
ncbi:Rossmann-like fold-containing protein [Kocuria rhizosphaericola]|uniref:Rossmann-like fold-containing protein n=1 Tax=Kocuria rhizosphaericola TaxID=3376284 RepID=UPI0037A7F3F3